MAAFRHSYLIRWISSAYTARKWPRLNRRLLLRHIAKPQSSLSQPDHKFAMRRDVGFAQSWRERLRPFANNNETLRAVRSTNVALSQTKLRLARAYQFDINLSENLGIKQRAVLRATRIVDAIPCTQIVKPVGTCRMLASRQ